LKQPRTLPSWIGATAFIVAFFVAGGWAVAIVLSAIDHTTSEPAVQLLTGLGGVLSGAVAGFLGAGAALIWRDRIRDDDDSREDKHGTG
jgi:membrane associated rhomboid family serine protease